MVFGQRRRAARTKDGAQCFAILADSKRLHNKGERATHTKTHGGCTGNLCLRMPAFLKRVRGSINISHSRCCCSAGNLPLLSHLTRLDDRRSTTTQPFQYLCSPSVPTPFQVTKNLQNPEVRHPSPSWAFKVKGIVLC